MGYLSMFVSGRAGVAVNRWMAFYDCLEELLEYLVTYHCLVTVFGYSTTRIMFTKFSFTIYLC